MRYYRFFDTEGGPRVHEVIVSFPEGDNDYFSETEVQASAELSEAVRIFHAGGDLDWIRQWLGQGMDEVAKVLRETPQIDEVRESDMADAMKHPDDPVCAAFLRLFDPQGPLAEARRIVEGIDLPRWSRPLDGGSVKGEGTETREMMENGGFRYTMLRPDEKVVGPDGTERVVYTPRQYAAKQEQEARRLEAVKEEAS